MAPLIHIGADSMSIHFPAHQLFPAADRRPDPADPVHFHPITRLLIIAGGAALCWCAVYFIAAAL
jgi:hypothetical protein